MTDLNKTSSNYSILSNRENLNEKQKKVVDVIKTDLLDVLEIDQKLVNRNNLVNEIGKNRKKSQNGIPSGNFTLTAGKSKSIEKGFDMVLKQYQSMKTEEEKQKLDTELAERIILDSGFAIEFKDSDKFSDGKNAKIESKLVFDGLNKVKKYENKIDLISNGDKNDFFLIKWKPSQLKIIESALKAIDIIESEGGNDEKAKQIEDLEKQVKDKDLKIKELIEKLKLKNQKEPVENLEESVEKIGEVERDLDNKDINYKKQMKEKVEKNLKKGATLRFKKGSTLVAELRKHSQDGFICNVCHDDELRKLIDKNHYVLDSDDNKSYISHIRNKDLWDFIGFQEEEKVPPVDPIVPPIDPSDYNLDLNAVISDMGTNVHRERVSLETEEELRDLYKGLAWYNLPKRAYLFLSRGKKRKKMIKKKMNALSGKAFSGISNIDEKTGDASDRHELELDHSLSEVEQANRVTIQNPLVNDLSKKFLLDQINETQFQQDFNTIVDNDANIQTILKGEKITHIGTNILLKLKQQKARMQLIQAVDTNLAGYSSDPRQAYIDNINREIESYITTYQQQPEFMKDYEDFINNVPGAKNKLDNYFNHQMSVMKMQVSNVKMNMDILVKGKSAYQIDSKDRQKGWVYKLGKRLDKLPWWVQTAGFIGVSVGTGILTGGLGTVAAAGITTAVTASTVGGLNFIKKWTHHTKEQNTHEKNVVTDYRNEQARIAEWQNQALNGKWYKWKTYKAKRQLALYDQTTQDNIYISETISDAITQLSTKIGDLNANEKNYMKKNLIEGGARLKYYREVGHNFLASNEKEKIEKDMKRLEKSLVLGVNKMGVNLIDIEAMTAIDDGGLNITYANVQKNLRNDYDKSLVQFKRERRNLATKYGIGTAALSAGMSLGMQYLMGTGVFGGGKEGIPGQAFSDSAKENFKLGKHDLLDTGTKNEIYNKSLEVFKDPRMVEGSKINIPYGAGTDDTSVKLGSLTLDHYRDKLTEVTNNIKALGLEKNMEDQFLGAIKSKQWEMDPRAFTNNNLLGMRSPEGIEQVAKAYKDSGLGYTKLNLSYDPKLSVPGTHRDNMSERFVTMKFDVTTPGTPGTPGSSRGRFVAAPLFFNTFKDRVDQKDKERSAKEGEEPRRNKNDLGDNDQRHYRRPTHF